MLRVLQQAGHSVSFSVHVYLSYPVDRLELCRICHEFNCNSRHINGFASDVSNSPACAANADEDDNETDCQSDHSNGHDRYN